MRFDWQTFLDNNGVEYVTHGPNVARGEIAIKCPFCGNDDPSHHMGLNLETGKWACWRDSSHAGVNPVRLIRKLLGISFSQAQALAGKGKVLDGWDNLDPQNLFSKPVSASEKVSSYTLSLPTAFKPYLGSGADRKFVNYLAKRGFKRSEVPDLFKHYNLHRCTSGLWKDRLILPIYMDGKLVTWTGRSLNKKAVVRYRSLTTDKDRAKEAGEQQAAIRNIKNCLPNFDELERTDRTEALIIVEGPLDYLKMDWALQNTSISVTCLFGASVSDAQAALLTRVSKRFNKMYVLLDKKETAKGMEVAAALSPIGARLWLPDLPAEDPGDLNKNQILELVEGV